jgi:uncharacterized protein (DUF1778 family)
VNAGAFHLAITRQTRSRRINLRTSKNQETLIRAGAKVRGVNVTDFILESACAVPNRSLATRPGAQPFVP